MAPKRRLDEKRKLQNREAQRRFRERAKLRNGTTKRSSEESSEKGSVSPENTQATASSFPNAYMQKDDLNATSTFIQSIFQTATLDSVGGNDSLQNALMASLTQLNKEMDRCDKEDILKYTATQSIECERRESSTSGSSISMDSTSPSESTYSSPSNQSSSSTSNWLGLTINEENPLDLTGVTDFTTEDWSQLMEQIVDPASLQLPVEMQQDTFSIPEIEILPQSQTMVLASPKKVDTVIAQSTRLPSPLGADQLLLPRLHFMQSAQLNADKLGLTFDYLHNCNAISTISEGWSRFRKQSRFDIAKIDPLKALQVSKAQYDIVAYAANAPDISQLIENKIRKSLRNGPTALQLRSENEWKWDNVSENMKPTDIQLSVEHHPYIDVAFPWKSMRDKIILLSGILFEPENLCIAAMYGDPSSGEQAFKIWGDDPSNEMTWEISESFIRQWWFLIDKSILRQTNWWRRQRGEKSIVEEKIV
ncbi:uncharacterized protein FA14DRAFT_162053 [Meira miltonrushii]|uniref:BZIP domain-containing protein n=1 Tax=Meira miltonrushii TaxID=1280837 RepID=A0A316V5H5_9BASI|nr:uncharacterized protein FA14DRAFT_162053 [Meira miltonrushii]PWN32766.1 hypothetical protein FA14DRAFT_162053 [Meira miltonrushii]